MPRKKPENICVVVKVESGVPVIAEGYRDYKCALRRERSLRKDMRSDNDETGIFEVRC